VEKLKAKSATLIAIEKFFKYSVRLQMGQLAFFEEI
jgi:hypothetical protein